MGVKGKRAEKPAAKAKIDAEEREAERLEREDGALAAKGHNRPELTEDEQRALTYSWKKKWEAQQAVVAKAKSDLRAIEDGAKSELGKNAVKDIKEMILIEMPGGNASVQAAIERQLKLARWVNSPVGSQFEFFEDRTPAEDRAFEEGKTAGLMGLPRKSPYHPSLPQHQRWIDGWHAGNEVLLSDFQSKLKPLGTKDGTATDPDQMDLSERNDLPPEGAGNDADVSDPPFLPPTDDMPTAPAAPDDDDLSIPANLRRTAPVEG
jgi:ribosome modulation factor